MQQLKAAKKAGDLWLICDGERREGNDLGAAAVGGLGLGAARPPVVRTRTAGLARHVSELVAN